MADNTIQSLIEQHHHALDTRINEVANRLDSELIAVSKRLHSEPDNPDFQEQYRKIDEEREAIIQHQQRLQRQLWQAYYDALIQADFDRVTLHKLADELYDYLIPNLYGQRDASAERKEEAQYPLLILLRHLRHRQVKLRQSIEYQGTHIPAGTTAVYTDIHPASGMGFKFADVHIFISETTKIQGQPIITLLTRAE